MLFNGVELVIGRAKIEGSCAESDGFRRGGSRVHAEMAGENVDSALLGNIGCFLLLKKICSVRNACSRLYLSSKPDSGETTAGYFFEKVRDSSSSMSGHCC